MGNITTRPTISLQHCSVKTPNNSPSNLSSFSIISCRQTGLGIATNSPVEEEEAIDNPLKSKNNVFVPKWKINIPTSSNTKNTKNNETCDEVNKPTNITSLNAEEMMLSDEYTCITFHDPNPKTTYIFSDRVLEINPDEHCTSSSKSQKQEKEKLMHHLVGAASSPDYDNGFLKFCYKCEKMLEGKDIFIYRGDASFCSPKCRYEVIVADFEEKKRKRAESPNKTSSTISSVHKVIFFVDYI